MPSNKFLLNKHKMYTLSLGNLNKLKSVDGKSALAITIADLKKKISQKLIHDLINQYKLLTILFRQYIAIC